MFVDDRMSELEEDEISAAYDSLGKLGCGLVGLVGRLTRLLLIPELTEQEFPRFNVLETWSDPQLRNWSTEKILWRFGHGDANYGSRGIRSEIGFVKSDYRQSWTDFSLEGCLQCLQFDALN